MIKLPKLIWIWIEIGWTKLLLLFDIEKDTSMIPPGLYCYVIDDEKNKLHPVAGYWIKSCKYFRRTKNKAGCTYVGFYGYDACLHDSCKICSINDDL